MQTIDYAKNADVMMRILKWIIQIVNYSIIFVVSIVIFSILTVLYISRTGIITPYARSFMNNNIEGEMWFDTLFINFDKFPLVNLKTTNGSLVSHVPYFQGDTLCRFDSLDIDIDILKIITKPTTIDIPRVYLSNAHTTVRLDTASLSSWSLWRFIPSKPQTEQKKKKSSPVILNIAKISLMGKSYFNYSNDHSGLAITTVSDSLFLDGRIAIDYKKIWANFLTFKHLDFYLHNPQTSLLIDLSSHDFFLDNLYPPAYANIGINLNRIEVKGYVLPKPALFSIDGYLAIDDFKKYTFNDFKLGFNKNFIKFDGNFDLKKTDSLFYSFFDMQIEVHSPSVQSLISYLPESVGYNQSDFQLNFPMTTQLELNGDYSPVQNKYPHILLSSEIPSGVIKMNKIPIASRILFDADLSMNIQKNQGTVLTIEKFNLSAFDTWLKYKGIFSLNKKQFHIDGNLNVNGELADLKAVIPDTTFNYSADYNASLYVNIEKGNKFEINDLCGDIDINSMSVQMNNNADSAYVDNLSLYLSPKIRSLVYDDSKRGFIASDSIIVRLVADSVSGYYSGLDFNIDEVKVKTKIGKENILTHYLPAKGNIDISDLNLNYEDQDTILVGEITSMFDIDNNTHELEVSSVIRNIFARSTYVNMVSPELGAVVRGDFRDTTKIPDIYGALLSDKIYLYSPVLPLNNELANMQILFSPEYLKIKNLDMTSGASNLNITGQFDNWSNFIYKKEKLVGNIDVVSDSLEVNQLIEAITRGVLYLDKREQPDIDSLMERIFPPYFLPPMEEPHSPKKALIYLPSNLNFKINLDAENIMYDKQKMQKASGTILVAENRLIINDLSFYSKEVGTLIVDAEYFTPDTLNAEASVSLLLSDLNVENLVSLTPDLVTLVPILSSVKGNVNCEMSAMAMLDSTMYVKLGTLDALARVEGSKLSIEKKRVLPKFIGWLLLGDRKLITLDSVSVDVEIKDSIISVYPFIANVGPYKFSASGVQNLDRSFFYHISILKWPLCFKLGFNVYGNDDDIHFRLASPKLTNLNLPARILSTSVTNLYPSYNIKKDFQKSVVEKQDAFNKLNEYYKSIIAMPDSLPYSKDEDLFDQLNKLKSNSNSGR